MTKTRDLADLGGGFIQAGTGAVQRTVESKLQDMVSVKDFGAVDDGVADDTAAIQAAINAGKPVFMPSGEYLVSSVLRTVANVSFSLIGNPGSVTIKATGGLSSIIAGPLAFGASTDYIFIQGIKFDGQHIRTTFPYSTIAGTFGATTALSFNANPDVDDSSFVVDNCEIIRTTSLPLIVDHYKKAAVTCSKFIRTKDPGFRFCQNVLWDGNLTRFGADNGVSVSRGCTKVAIANSIFEDVEVAGIWVSGFNVTGTGTFTLTGGAYTAGSTLTMTAAGGASLSLKDKDVLFTLYDSGLNECTVKVTSLTSSSEATVVALDAVPAGLQAIASNSWKYAPHGGVDTFTVSNCIVDGALSAGFHGGIAPSSGIVSGCVFQRSGYIADSEVYSTGSVVSGSNQLVLEDATGFAALSWIVVKPKTGLQPKFVAKISSVAGNTLTLDRNAPDSYVAETVYLCHYTDIEGWGAYITGNGTGSNDYAENIHLEGCSFISGRGIDVYLGNSTLTPIRNIIVSSCTFVDPYNLKKSTAEGLVGNIRIAEPISYPISNVVIQNNTSDLALASGKAFVTAYVRGTTRRSLIVRDNYLSNGSDAYHVYVFDIDNANADITNLYTFSWIDNYGSSIDQSNKAGAWYELSAAEVASINSTGILLPKSNRIIITPTAALTINSIDWSLLGINGIPECHIENASATDNITFTHDDAAIRCPGNTSVVLAPRDYVAFGKRNSTVSYKLM